MSYQLPPEIVQFLSKVAQMAPTPGSINAMTYEMLLGAEARHLLGEIENSEDDAEFQSIWDEAENTILALQNKIEEYEAERFLNAYQEHAKALKANIVEAPRFPDVPLDKQGLEFP